MTQLKRVFTAVGIVSSRRESSITRRSGGVSPDSWTFTGSRGDTITISVAFEREQTARIRVVDPNGTTIIDSEGPTHTTTLAADGQYTIYPVSSDAPGVYTLSLEKDNDDGASEGLLSGDALYVWENAATIVSTDTTEFITQIKPRGIERVFVSWGGLTDEIRDPANETLSAFMRECAANGITVSLLWGKERGLDGIRGALGDLEQMRAHSPEAIHFDIEPKQADERDVFLSGFLDFYESMLTHGQFGETAVSVYINPYWADITPSWAERVHNHDAVDRIVIAAYRDSTAEIIDRIETVRAAGNTKPYYAAVELQDPTQNAVVDPSITLWEDGTDAAEIVDDVSQQSPDQAAFQGIALHHYAPLTSGQYDP